MEELEKEIHRRYLDRLDEWWYESDPKLDFGASALPYFIAAFANESDPKYRARLINVIWEFRDLAALPALATAFRDRSSEVWKNSLDGIVCLGGEQALAVLKEARAATLQNPAETEKLKWIDEAIIQVNEGVFGTREGT